MISFGNGEVNYITYGNKIINTVYYGAKIVWQSIVGWWINDRPYKNEQQWRNQ